MCSIETRKADIMGLLMRHAGQSQQDHSTQWGKREREGKDGHALEIPAVCESCRCREGEKHEAKARAEEERAESGEHRRERVTVRVQQSRKRDAAAECGSGCPKW